MNKAVELYNYKNAIDLSPYYSFKEKVGEYGEKNTICQFDKMRCCDDICSMEKNVLVKIFANLKKEIDELLELFEHNDDNI